MLLRVAAKVGHQDIRTTNRRLVLQSMFRSDACSRADLARSTGLTPATVSDLVAALFAEGLAEERGRGPAKVGKPSRLVGLNPLARYVVCVDLSDDSVLRGAVSDLSGELGRRVELPSGRATGEAAVAQTMELVSEVIKATPGPILGIGVGTPGVVTASGRVIEADNLGWFDLDLTGRLSAEFGLPASVANDANTAALAEYSYAGSESQNLMVVKIGHGVGAGVVVNGSQYYGDSFAAGEIGHIGVDDDGPLCRCGNRGCLETFLSVPRLEEAVAAGRDPELVIARAGHHLGAVLAAVVSVLDIHEILVSGTGLSRSGALFDAALATLRRRTLRRLGESVTLRPSDLGTDVVLLGANALVLSQELGVV